MLAVVDTLNYFTNNAMVSTCLELLRCEIYIGFTFVVVVNIREPERC